MAGFEKGHKKHPASGLKKGQKTKKTRFKKIIARIEDNDDILIKVICSANPQEKIAYYKQKKKWSLWCDRALQMFEDYATRKDHSFMKELRNHYSIKPMPEVEAQEIILKQSIPIAMNEKMKEESIKMIKDMSQVALN